MAVFIVSRVDIAEPERMTEYMRAAPATVEAFGGRYVVRTGNIQVIEGTATCDRMVVLEFPTREQALGWYHSELYRPLRDLRWQVAKASILLLDPSAATAS
ncbi:DUF1330 domain-containing protein [Phreatobacter sp. AB_2022a]|uniref:DUF1330 domain-containing protein n=1 Tax=Phreatobacter sp. AB_2022a TaxID=3003134 RepID=UPI0022876A70|nr:DUF1330 domain-containing protein [Phreatobacter sp. AB_2022a]MCZ0737973.1 DUF1330 domain-containing protein [Phreatobacter sp. AB_2022a]